MIENIISEVNVVTLAVSSLTALALVIILFVEIRK